MLGDHAETSAFARDETLRYEIYRREHFPRRAEGDTLTRADCEDIPMQPAESADGA